MKRFVTYLYKYKDGQKMKNTGHIRVDVRNQLVNMQINIRDGELEKEIGTFYIIVRTEKVYGISLEKITMHSGQYNGRLSYNCQWEGMNFTLENVIGVCIQYENGDYMASCWRDGEEVTVAVRKFVEPRVDIEAEAYENIESSLEVITKADVIEEIEDLTEEEDIHIEEKSQIYHKMNLNEIYKLPSRHWHFSNNSFLIHGFWNYGYLVLKESVEENYKRMSLGVPGIFEQPEMVMAAYFGFAEFEALPPQVLEMEIGAEHTSSGKTENQPPQVGTFGCWFVNL